MFPLQPVFAVNLHFNMISPSGLSNQGSQASGSCGANCLGDPGWCWWHGRMELRGQAVGGLWAKNL